ncbi:hypothetical protein Patl1_34293 [Pistacia atlantica]|uniref:Uncharacterized protein n=1 Tax=Pistacia atlantica TaxID=434234 RepID=A0ACC0ZQ60_9ROSI|nr:hypothetical protein Patl1_34293 [Pistacia atlantica]
MCSPVRPSRARALMSSCTPPPPKVVDRWQPETEDQSQGFSSSSGVKKVKQSSSTAEVFCRIWGLEKSRLVEEESFGLGWEVGAVSTANTVRRECVVDRG